MRRTLTLSRRKCTLPPGRRVLGVVLMLSILLSGCTTDPEIIGDPYSGAGPGTLGIDGSGDTSPTVGWVEPGVRFYVMTYGSGSCPTAPTALTVEQTVLTVEMTRTGGNTCTDDLGPASYAIDLPRSLRGADIINVTLEFEEERPVELSLTR